ncbi:flagellar hook-basal body complex protein [Alkalibaculum sp. M08DMB]|uniref:Flagellar hook-basal body complex protein n=1 Tax=Alkalibaculum sporogenes TaxID=2655001 RepID=A0A6A7K5V5_9FIRM|nr:flagellar hook-basal body protein [Alkalibaculum sporogenes]MPW24816.1 flagellar hook-basal body complex protein [Alkalibaculum sporogenes]
MYNILSIGKSGMNATQNKMNSISDDLANANTMGYKSKIVNFQELLVNEMYDNEVLKSNNVNVAVINAGTKGSEITNNFNQGGLITSTGEFHMAIEGSGFFGVRDAAGNLMLTRNGGFHLNENNTISDDSGYPLEVDLNVPYQQWGNSKVAISTSGEITQEMNGETVLLGRVILYNPDILDSLTPLGEGRYIPSPNVELFNSIDQPNLFGNIQQNYLESSNVEIVKSMAEMIITQRAYSMNAKTIQSTDEIMQVINNIKQ